MLIPNLRSEFVYHLNKNDFRHFFEPNYAQLWQI